MKNKILKITFLLLITGAYTMQAQSFAKGQKDINIGLGLGGGYGSNTTVLYAGETQSSTPPISAALEFGVTDAISIGGYVAYTGTKWTYTGTDYDIHGNPFTYSNTDSWKFYIIGVRGAYHFAQFISNDKVDLYAGVMLGDVISTQITQ